jgi:hypothetical protein
MHDVVGLPLTTRVLSLSLYSYIFDLNGDKTKATLQEIGPRFTLKMK